MSCLALVTASCRSSRLLVPADTDATPAREITATNTIPVAVCFTCQRRGREPWLVLCTFPSLLLSVLSLCLPMGLSFLKFRLCCHGLSGRLLVRADVIS